MSVDNISWIHYQFCLDKIFLLIHLWDCCGLRIFLEYFEQKFCKIPFPLYKLKDSVAFHQRFLWDDRWRVITFKSTRPIYRSSRQLITPKVLWLSCFLSNYQFISFGGCFWIFGASNNPDSLLFLFSCHCQSVSCYCQQKKFCPNFSDATLLPALLQKRSEICLCYSF